MTQPIHSAGTTDADTDGAPPEALLERLVDCVRDVSLGFDRWDDQHARGPGLYFVVVGSSTPEFVAPMGANRWPVEDCASVFAEPATLQAAAKSVAASEDGAIVVHADGTIEEVMVRMNQLAPDADRGTEDPPFAGWMGTRHMSALETSTRRGVVAAITLSEEDGRVTLFSDGTFEDPLAAAQVTE